MTLLTVSAARSFARREPLKQLHKLVLQAQKVAASGATRAGTRLLRMGSVCSQHIHRQTRRCRASSLRAHQVRWQEAVAAAILVPRRDVRCSRRPVRRRCATPRQPPAQPGCGKGRSGTARCRPGHRQATASLAPRASSSSTSRIWQREASNQQSASASGKVTPWRWP